MESQLSNVKDNVVDGTYQSLVENIQRSLLEWFLKQMKSVFDWIKIELH